MFLLFLLFQEPTFVSQMNFVTNAVALFTVSGAKTLPPGGTENRRGAPASESSPQTILRHNQLCNKGRNVAVPAVIGGGWL
jgi:hypothetical protein